MNDEVLYLVRVDGEECSFVRGESEAKLVIDSIAVSEVIRLSKELKGRKIFREENGTTIRILSQSENILYTNAPKVRTVIDYVPVGYSFLTKNRLSLQGDIPVPPVAPTEEAIEEIVSKKKSLSEILGEYIDEVDITSSESSEDEAPPLPKRDVPLAPRAPMLPTHSELRKLAHRKRLGLVTMYYPDRTKCSRCQDSNVEIYITKIGPREMDDLITHQCKSCKNMWEITILRK